MRIFFNSKTDYHWKLFAYSSNSFDGLLQLLKLDLSRNNITIIQPDAFHGLVSLQNLDLSFNKITRLDNKTNGVLDFCLSLQKVKLIFSETYIEYGYMRAWEWSEFTQLAEWDFWNPTAHSEFTRKNWVELINSLHPTQ